MMQEHQLTLWKKYFRKNFSFTLDIFFNKIIQAIVFPSNARWKISTRKTIMSFWFGAKIRTVVLASFPIWAWQRRILEKFTFFDCFYQTLTQTIQNCLFNLTLGLLIKLWLSYCFVKRYSKLAAAFSWPKVHKE